MKNSRDRTFRHLAIGGAMFGTVTFSSAVGFASIIAFDSASDPVYADGWQAGDNGGTGFTPWNFDTDFGLGIHSIDDGLQSGGVDSSPFNAIGTAWRLAVPDGELPRAGRGFAPLEIGQTLMITLDNPSERQFFRGYFVRLSGGTGGVNGNICYGGLPCSAGGTPAEKMRFQTFEYFTNGEWSISDSGFTATGVFDTDTSAAGAIFQVTRTGAESYDVVMDSLGPGSDFFASRTFDNAGPPVDWIEFIMFGAVTDIEQATDFYISSMQISDEVAIPEPGSLALGFAAGAVALFSRWRSRTRRFRG